MVTLKGPWLLLPASGQYCRDFILPPSTRFVSITMEGHFSCQINLQKSMTVFERGAGELVEHDSHSHHEYTYTKMSEYMHAAYIRCYQESIEVIYMHISSLPCHFTVCWFGMRNMIITSKCCISLCTAAPVFMYLHSCPDRWHHCLPCVAMNLRGGE